jgi:hypothetical protein
MYLKYWLKCISNIDINVYQILIKIYLQYIHWLKPAKYIFMCSSYRIDLNCDICLANVNYLIAVNRSIHLHLIVLQWAKNVFASAGRGNFDAKKLQNFCQDFPGKKLDIASNFHTKDLLANELKKYSYLQDQSQDLKAKLCYSTSKVRLKLARFCKM